jgi:hypothetical protein
MASVTFDSAAFIVRYPEFASVDSARLQAFFDEATLYLSNSDDSPVSNVTRRAVLLNMLAAHIASLSGVFEADGRPLPAGRVSQASQGSVSVSFEGVPPTPGTGPWFQQTQYGSSFWQATSNLRGFRYISNPTRWR